MASNRTEFNAALAVWDDRRANNEFSVPHDSGSLAILCPYIDKPDREEFDRWPAFEAEALMVADNYHHQGKLVEVALHAALTDFKSIFSDPSVSDVVIIGHGCLSSVEVTNPDGHDLMDWLDVSRAADHLKTGVVVQRMCGGLPRKLNVPLGLFAVNDHRHVQAAVGIKGDIGALDTENQIIHAVTAMPRMGYEDIKEAFPQRHLPLLSRTRVVLGAAKAALIGQTTTMDADS
ncbi:MAG TPA: hypothetical protein VK983_03260 [Candidatus Limnocylindrales bacterium]|nr:hypothetical protein [Candidatus Limnocylindrales bacterium]